jgi:hypothetical protein
MTAPRLVALLACVAACSPLRFHRDTNAPGVIDVSEPPSNVEPGQTALPGDPGERMVTFNPGLFGGAGYAPSHDGGERWVFPLGVELTLNRGERDRSHFRDDFFVYPVRGEGVNLGWAAIELGGDDTEIGPLYLEYQRFETVYGAAAGLAFDPDDVDFGAQGTVWYGPYYLRVRYLIDGGAEVIGGLQIKVPLVWISSR